MYQNINKKTKNLRDIIIVLLLSIWMMIPVLKEIKVTYFISLKYEYAFIIIVGMVGLIFLMFDIYKNYIKAEDKRKYYIEILPIILLLVFMIWTFVCSLVSPNIYNAFWGTEYRKEGYITYLAYAGFFSCAFSLKSKESRKLILNFFVTMAILNIVAVQIENLGIFTNILAPREANRTCFFNSNHYGYYLLLATITANFLFITEENKLTKILYLLIYSILSYYTMINNTFGCYLSILFTLIFYVIYCIVKKKNRKVAIISLIIFILLSSSNQRVKNLIVKNINGLISDISNVLMLADIENKGEIAKANAINIAESSGSGRIKIWRHGIEFFFDSPIFGYGPENLESKYEEVKIVQDRPHNLLIQLANTSGAIGLVTYLISIIIILIRGLKTLNRENKIHIISFACVLTYLMSAMFGNSMYYTSPYFFIFLGLLMNENIRNVQKDEPKTYKSNEKS